MNKVNREEKKKLYREKIVNTYKELLDRVGFDSATTALISEETGIAQGTIFNHFSTKGDLLIAVYHRYFFLKSDDFLSDNPFSGEVGEWLLKYLNSFLDKSREFPRDCLRALFSLSYNSGKKETYLQVEKLDKIYLNEFEKVLSIAVRDIEVDLSFLLELIYSLLMTNYMNYSVTDISFELFSGKLIKDINKLLILFNI